MIVFSQYDSLHHKQRERSLQIYKMKIEKKNNKITKI